MSRLPKLARGALILGVAAAAIVACTSSESERGKDGPRIGSQASRVAAPCVCSGVDPTWLNDPADPAPNTPCPDGMCLMGTNVPGARAWACTMGACFEEGPGDGGVDATLPPQDAALDATCDPTPSGPGTSTIPVRVNLGYDFPGGAAICPQLVAIPFVGPALFSPTGSIGFNVDVQYDKSQSWKAVCLEENKSTFGAGISVNICGLTAEGRWEKSTTDLAAHCVDCEPPPGACGAVACTDHTESQTRQFTLTRSFDFPLGGSSNGNDACMIGGAPGGRRWLDWIKQHLNLSASVGGGWNGKTTEMGRSGPGGCRGCTPCETKDERNSIFLQASARASISTPSWLWVSGSAYGELTGRAGVGRFDQISTCVMPPTTCGGYNANASITLRLGVSASAFGFNLGGSIGYTCRWSNSWSNCKDTPADYAECGWSQPTDP